MMKISNDLSKTQWEAEVAEFGEANFLQSWNWGEFQLSLGKTVVRLAWQEQETGKYVALTQAVVEKARRGGYLAVAGGPLIDWQNLELVKEVFQALRIIAQENRCWFVRFRPQAVLEQDSENLAQYRVPSLKQNTVKMIGGCQAPMHLTADLTLQLDLSSPEEELLANMRKNHRQSINKAAKLGITTRISHDIGEIPAFYQAQQLLAKRHGFVPFSQEFLTKQFAAFSADNQVALIHAEYQSQLLATAFVIFYNYEAVYHYGVSTELNQQLPGSYASQWRAIQEAKARGCKRYNFWGVAPLDQPHHRFAGVGLFKRGFGGREVGYLPAQDIVIDQRYYLTRIFEIGRKKLRKL